MESLFWRDWTSSSVRNNYIDKLKFGRNYFERWPNVYPDSDLFVGNVNWEDAN